jgi:hypothetical protein
MTNRRLDMYLLKNLILFAMVVCGLTATGLAMARDDIPTHKLLCACECTTPTGTAVAVHTYEPPAGGCSKIDGIACADETSNAGGKYKNCALTPVKNSLVKAVVGEQPMKIQQKH